MEHLRYYIISLFIVLIDQISKLTVHLNMRLGEEINVIGDWFRLHYVLNPGIAFGIELDFEYGKLLLTGFRILAACGIAFYIYYLSRRNTHRMLLLSLSLDSGRCHRQCNRQYLLWSDSGQCADKCTVTLVSWSGY